MANIKVILDNKKAMKWWLDGGEVAIYNNNAGGSWKETYKPDWDCINCIYIPKDTYFEFRKALIEGKVVEMRTLIENYAWVEISSDDFKHPVQNYRIKHSFKIGDYVRVKTTNYMFKITRAPINGLFYEDTSSRFDSTKNEYAKYHESDLKLWTPKEGEWVILYKIGKDPSITMYHKDNLHDDLVILPFIGQVTWKN